MSERLKVPPEVLFRIAERDRWKCHICDLGYMPENPWEIDHDTPLAKGGTNHISNLRLAHKTCNRDKATA